MKKKKITNLIEYFKTYGWLWLIGIVIVYALFYFNIANIPINKFNPEKDVCEYWVESIYYANTPENKMNLEKNYDKVIQSKDTFLGEEKTLKGMNCEKHRPKNFCEKCVDNNWCIVKSGYPIDCNNLCEERCACDEWNYDKEHIISQFNVYNITINISVAQNCHFCDATKPSVIICVDNNCSISDYTLCCDNPKCLSAHLKNECEKNNINYVWDIKQIYLVKEGEFEVCYNNNVSNSIPSRGYTINSNDELVTFYLPNKCDDFLINKKICRKKQFSDISCDELKQKIIEGDRYCKSRNKWRKSNNLIFCVPDGWTTTNDLFRIGLLEMGCFK